MVTLLLSVHGPDIHHSLTSRTNSPGLPLSERKESSCQQPFQPGLQVRHLVPGLTVLREAGSGSGPPEPHFLTTGGQVRSAVVPHSVPSAPAAQWTQQNITGDVCWKMPRELGGAWGVLIHGRRMKRLVRKEDDDEAGSWTMNRWVWGGDGEGIPSTERKAQRHKTWRGFHEW